MSFWQRQHDAVDAVGSQFAAVRAGPATVVRVQQPADCRGSKVPVVATTAREPEPATVEPGHRAGLDAPGTLQDITVNVARCEEIASRAVTDAAHVLWLQDSYVSVREAYAEEGNSP